jgi:hypothetical protein
MTASERAALGAMAALMLVAGRASADESSKIVAEQLFTAGRGLLEAGQVDAACDKLRESQRVDPAGGTAVLLGICFKRQGKLASAWGAFRTARAMATRDGRQDRIDIAERELQAIQPGLAYLAIEVSPGAQVPGLQVTLDDVAIGEASRDLPIPVDPGPHALRATAPGFAAFARTVAIAQAPGTTQATIEPLVPDAPRDASRASGSQASSGSRALPLALAGGLGLVALGVTVYFGVDAASAENRKPTSCLTTDSDCAGRRQSLESQRNTDATIATVGACGVAAAGAAAAIVLLWPQPRATSGALRVTPYARGGLALSGSF